MIHFFGNFRGFQNIVRIVVMNWNNPRFSPSSFSDTNDKKKSTPYGVLFFLEMKRSLWEHEDACTNEVAVAYEVCLRHDKERFASYFAKQNAS